jgi:hypothetical protein
VVSASAEAMVALISVLISLSSGAERAVSGWNRAGLRGALRSRRRAPDQDGAVTA